MGEVGRGPLHQHVFEADEPVPSSGFTPSLTGTVLRDMRRYNPDRYRKFQWCLRTVLVLAILGLVVLEIASR